MPEPLKNVLNAEAVHALARDLHRAHPALRTREFARECLGPLDGLELLQRARHIAGVMHRHLPSSFAAAATVLIDSMGPELARSDEFGLAPLRYLPHVFFIREHGLGDFESAMRAQHELTRRFTAESSIRPFLERYPRETCARLREWTQDPNVHVRRLVSEGTRPRLPWAPRLVAFQKDPKPVLALLELLKDDPERYVQRSVANSLNDISKDHPDIAVDVCRRWSRGASAGRAWIVSHALRSLVKAGHRGALAVMGVARQPRVRIHGARLSTRRVAIGGVLRFSFDIESLGRTRQDLLVDYAVHFVKANGGTRPKVFKLRRLVLPPAARTNLGGSVSFKPMTTRRPRPGRHRIDVLVNGVVFPLASFEVRSSSAASRKARAFASP